LSAGTGPKKQLVRDENPLDVHENLGLGGAIFSANSVSRSVQLV
jgi:hypothetical protein